MTFGLILKNLIKKPTAIFSLTLLLIFGAVAVFAPVIAPPSETAMDEQMMLQGSFNRSPQPPSEEHVWGTTVEQYDIFYGVVWGTRTAFQIGIGIAFFTSLIGLIIGSVSGYFGGWIDELLMRVTEIFQAFPFFLIVIILTSVLQYFYERGEEGIMLASTKILAFVTFGQDFFETIPPSRLVFLVSMIAIIMFGWMEIARVIRGNILVIKSSEYALAARTIGAKNSRILFRHLVPNALFPLFVLAPMNIGTYVLTFAALSFLGIGVPEGYAEWGHMLSLAHDWLLSFTDYPYLIIYPGAAIILFVLSWNLLGDAMRDILDPRTK
ncbi:MAG TPA: ABC transporter permease [Anaerolineales bacterium]|nr:ABC transporter permease [Anaerolineales bacterium]